MNEILEKNIVKSINSLEYCDSPNLRIIWNDKIENYSAERIKEIKLYASRKYNTDKVTVLFNPTNTIKYVNVSNDTIESLSSPDVQIKLFKEWMEENNVDIKFEDLQRLDKKVEANIIDKQETRFVKWSIKKLLIDNFLSYGNETIIDFTKLNGFNIINGKNTSGKSTILDALLFLFFNQTTKNKIADEILNIYTDKDYARVEGEIIIDGITYIIDRIIKRKWKKDKSTHTTSTELNFYKLLPDGSKEDLNGEQRSETDKIIKESIGSPKDFLMTIVSTGDNLFAILEAKATERGQVIMKFLGLEIFEQKEIICKNLYSEWKEKAKLNQYNETTLEFEINELIKNIELKGEDKENLLSELNKIKNEIEKNTTLKDRLLLTLNKEIEKKFININETHINSSIDVINKSIDLKNNEINKFNELIKNNDVDFDVNKHNEIYNEEREIAQEGILLKSETDNINKLIKDLENSEFCPSCKQPLKNVDHSEEIKQNKIKYEKNLLKIIDLKEKYNKIKIKLDESENIKNKANELERNKLKKEKLEIELDSLNLKLKNEQNNLEEYISNLKTIENNKIIENEIREVDILLSSLRIKERDTSNDIKTIEIHISSSNESISNKKELIKTLRSETYIQKIFLTYQQMCGKNGISKTILKHSIPTINAELNRLLVDVCDFGISIDINIKNNEVELWMFNNEKQIKKPLMTGSGFERTVACMALRVILNKINSLPHPNLIIFDECLDKVDDENLENIKLFLDKIKNMFDQIFIISHKLAIKDWGDNILMVQKINDISQLSLQKCKMI